VGARHVWAWAHALAVRQPLPVLPSWIPENFAVPLELEATYEEPCRILRVRWRGHGRRAVRPGIDDAVYNMQSLASVTAG
jgi:hypothetical protein